jgi:predicted metal-dependent HD superfamily phosphohydrolase
MFSDRYTRLKHFWLNKLQRELPSYLLYHNVDHTRNVINACSYLAEKEGLAPREKELLLLAALFHDAGYLTRYESNEHAGAQTAELELSTAGYSTSEIETISELILSTHPEVEPRGLLQEIIHDADLNYLGRPDYLSRSESLRSELSFVGHVYDDNEWLKLQHEFISQFNYCTKSAIKMVGTGLQSNKVLVANKMIETKE